MRFDDMGPNFMIAEKGSEDRSKAEERREIMAQLLQFAEERLHFGAGVLVAFFLCGGHAVGENGAGVVVAAEVDEELAELLVGGNVVGSRFDEFAEMFFGGGGVAEIHALDGKAVAREDVIGLGGDEFFEALAARLLLGRLGHGSEAGIIAAGLRSAKASGRG